MKTDRADFFQQVYRLVRHIPAGKVASYGQIARMLGVPNGARMVGWAMGSAPSGDVPWHRVVNARGEVSLRPGGGAELQRALLEEEGVAFGAGGRIDLARHGWEGLEPPEVEALLRGDGLADG
mgnify:CR=1 FL=1